MNTFTFIAFCSLIPFTSWILFSVECANDSRVWKPLDLSLVMSTRFTPKFSNSSILRKETSQCTFSAYVKLSVDTPVSILYCTTDYNPVPQLLSSWIHHRLWLDQKLRFFQEKPETLFDGNPKLEFIGCLHKFPLTPRRTFSSNKNRSAAKCNFRHPTTLYDISKWPSSSGLLQWRATR